MEAYILTAVTLLAFISTVVVFRFLIDDPDQAALLGAAAGLLVALVAGYGYFSYLASASLV